MLNKKVESQGDSPKLTKSEQEILYLLTEEFLTVKKIAIRRKTSDKAVYKLLEKLKEKGAIKERLKKVENFEGTFQPNGIRLHGEVWHLKVLDRSDNYKDLIGKQVVIDGNSVHVHRDVIMVYSSKSFFGEDTIGATVKGLKYWNRFFVRLENDFKTILVKSRCQNVKRVKQEYAQVNNGLAKKCESEGDKIRIRTLEDGKVWFTIDNSFNLHEAETSHPKDANVDMQEVVEPFFNDLRYNRPPTLSDIMGVMMRLVEANKETASGLNAVVTFVKSQLPKSAEEKEVGGKGAVPSYIG